MSKSHNIKYSWIVFLAPLIQGMINPLAELQKPFPKQHLVTRDIPSVPQEVVEETTHELEYEDIVVFSLKATIAAFHINPKTFIQDQQRLNKYFEPHALSQIDQSLYAATGTGLLDHYILTGKTCDAITRSPVVIEKQSPHYLQVRLPMILVDKREIDVILSIQVQDKLRISDFSIEKPL